METTTNGGNMNPLPLMDANSDNPLEASIARLRTTQEGMEMATADFRIELFEGARVAVAQTEKAMAFLETEEGPQFDMPSDSLELDTSEGVYEEVLAAIASHGLTVDA